jgi:hypothetical protein
MKQVPVPDKPLEHPAHVNGNALQMPPRVALSERCCAGSSGR